MNATSHVRVNLNITRFGIRPCPALFLLKLFLFVSNPSHFNFASSIIIARAVIESSFEVFRLSFTVSKLKLELHEMFELGSK